MQSTKIAAVIDHYLTKRPRCRPGDKERRLIGKRLKEGYTIQELKTAIDGNFASPFHSGQNDQQTKYHNLSLIFRDSDKVAQFLDLAEQHTKRPEQIRQKQQAWKLALPELYG